MTAVVPDDLNLKKFPGEDIASAADLRKILAIPADQELSLKCGVVWCQTFNCSSAPDAADKTPIIICIGGTGAALFYKEFATKLSETYGGKVVLWDRYNIGLSDRTKQRNEPGLWTEQLEELLERLQIKRAHFAGFSLAGLTVPMFACAHPERVVSMALWAPIYGGLKKDQGSNKLFSSLMRIPPCLRRSIGHKLALTKLVPLLYERCEGQVEEGADPTGLGVAKGMYRVKHTSKTWMESMVFTELAKMQRHGAPKLVQRTADLKVPVYVRVYDDDPDIDRPNFNKLTEILTSTHANSSSDSRPGKHHQYYADDSVRSLATFFTNQCQFA